MNKVVPFRPKDSPSAAPKPLIRVLLIASDKSVYRLIRDMLAAPTHGHYETIWVNDFETGLTCLRKDEHDVGLIDHQLSPRTGLELLEDVRRHPLSMPLILLTAPGDDRLGWEAITAGVADYLDKTTLSGPWLERVIRYAMEHQRTRDALQLSEQRYAAAMESTQDGLWDWDLRTDCVYYSPRWKAILGHAGHEITDSSVEWLSRVHVEDIEKLQRAIQACIVGESASFTVEHRIRHQDGSYRWVISCGRNVTCTHTLPRIMGAMTDISERRHFQHQRVYDALHDALTGLPNRAFFIEQLQHALARYQRQPGTHCAVLILDLDRFKTVNDSLGHTAGDQFLKTVAERLKASMRPGDTIARFGADEFALCLEHIRHEDDALRASARIKQALQAPVSIQGQSLFTSASMGIALSSDQYHQAEELIRDADIAMYHAKAEGRAHHAVFRSSMYHQVIRRAQTENELRHALDHEEFVLYYQPIVMAQTQTVAGFEALLRWHNPRLGGNIPTSEFIYLAEDTGLIVPIGWWVLEQACRQIQSLETVPERGEPVTVSVNLSAKQFSQKNLVPTIETILAKTGLSPTRLHLEITESALMDRSGQAIEILNQLNTLGIHCHIDDFGTGYSSLSYLYQFPCSALKIDRSFISRMETSSKHKAIVETIVTLAHNLDLQVVAEGIETRAQCDAVKAIGCEYLQGFWLSLPLSWQEVTPLIAQDQVTLPVQT